MRIKPEKPELICNNKVWMIRCTCGNRCWGGNICSSGCEARLPLEMVKKRNLLNYMTDAFGKNANYYFELR